MSGKALSAFSTTSILCEDIPLTLSHMATCMGLDVNELVTVGSAGKAVISGDIDIALNVNNHDPNQIHDRLVSLFGPDRCNFNKGTKIGSYAVPITGDPLKGFVQVDLMFVPNVEWAKFSFFSAGDVMTKHKAVVRNILLQSVAATLDVPGIDMTVFDDVEYIPYIKIKRGLDITNGFRRIIHHYPKKKRGNGYTVTPISTSLDELKVLYPTLNFSNLHDYPTIFDPEKALKEMFGFDVNVRDVATAERVVVMINKLPYVRRASILKRCRTNLHNTAKYSDEQIKELIGV